MRDRIRDIEEFLRRSIEHRVSSHDVDYFTGYLALKPLRVIIKSLLEDSVNNKIDLVLDVGCGIGLFTFLTYSNRNGSLHPALSTVGIDIDRERPEIARILLRRSNKVHLLRSSVSHLPFRAKVFQAALVHDLFCYLNLNPVVSEIARVTGTFIYFDVPNKFFYTMFPFLRPNPSYLMYDLDAIRKKMQSLGSKVTRILPAPVTYLTRGLRFPTQIARAFFAFMLALPRPFRKSLCALWPLVVFRVQVLPTKRS